jgi:hypothetical protein
MIIDVLLEPNEEDWSHDPELPLSLDRSKIIFEALSIDFF